MRVSEFEWANEEKDLENWLHQILGFEIFEPDARRLETHFKVFKEKFKDTPIVTVAGTNGKGEVCLYLEDLLLQNEYEPYLFTSPHVLSVRERFSLQGRPIEGKRLLNLFHQFEKLAKELSYYEFLLFIFCQAVGEEIAQGAKKPVIIFEVGLGGRLDATNYFDADITGLASIGRDHLEFLGPTLKDVLREKLGITREGKPLFCAVEQPVLRDQCLGFCERKGIPLTLVPVEEGKKNFKERNWRLAIEIFHGFLDEFSKEKSQRDLLFQRPDRLWARPFEVTYNGLRFTLIGSHNLDGLRAMAHWANELRPEGQCSSSFDEIWVGLSRKDEKEILQCLELIDKSSCLGEVLRLFAFEHPRATPLERLKENWALVKRPQKKKVTFEKDFKLLFSLFESSQKDSKEILVCGSYYFLASVLAMPEMHRHLYSQSRS